MAYNPHPKVDDARTFARKWVKDKVIILAINDSDSTLELVAYGANARKCNRAKELGDVAYEAILKYLGGK